MMDLDDIRIFTQVIESGSFTKAALALDMPKSTVSRRLSTLEDELNVRLLHRTTRKLHLTPAGQLYFTRTARIMNDLRDAQHALSEMEDSPRGLLRITIPGDLGGEMPQLLAAFQEKYPLVELSVFTTGRRVDLVAEGIDLALRAGTLTDSSLMSRRLLSTTFALYANPSYLEKFGTPQCLEDLSQHRCLIFGMGAPRTVWKFEGPEGLREVGVSGPLSSNDFALLRSSTIAAMGIGYLPTMMDTVANRKLFKNRLRPVLPAYHSYESHLHAVYPSPRHLSPKVRAFIDFAADWLKAHNQAI